MNLKIPDDFIDLLLVTRLGDELQYFKDALRKKKPMIFVVDPAADKQLIREQIKAREVILEYYGA
jgi:hypothetical protein